MSDTALQLTEIRLDRVLGIDRPGFALSDLSPAVNLVYGPNGSGKSTTALAIQELLWPGRTGLDRPTVSGRFELEGDPWQITLDAGHPEVSRNGRPGDLPPCGPAEHAARYRLALHELVTTEDTDFAEAIASASQGGYDVEAAARSLGFALVPTLPRRLVDELRQARREFDDARQRQEELRRQEQSLTGLRQRLSRSDEARRRAALLEAAQACQEAAAERDALIEQRSAFPEVLGRLRGDERDTLDDLAAQIRKQEERRDAEGERLRQAQRQLDELDLPQEGVPEGLLENLRGWQHQLGEAERQLVQATEDLAKARRAAEVAERRLGEHLIDAQRAALDSIEIADLNALARDAHQVQAERAVYDERGRQLERERVDLGEAEGFEPTVIQRGLTALEEWLASPAPAERPKSLGWPVIAAAALGVVLASALAVVHHPAWAVGALGAIALLFAEWQRLRGRGDAVADPRVTHRQTYTETDLPAPAAWEAQPVRELHRRLLGWLAAHRDEGERLKRLAAWRDESGDLETREQQLATRRADVEGRLGVQLGVTDVWLPTLVESLAQFHRSTTETEAAAQVVETQTVRRDKLLANLNEKLTSVGVGAVESAAAAARTLDRLGEWAATHRQARRTISDARNRLTDDIEPTLDGLATRRQNLLAELGLDDEQERQLDEWLEQLGRYRELQSRLSDAETVLGERRRQVTGHEELLDVPPDELTRQLAQFQEVAARRDEVFEEISRITDRLEQAKSGHVLSEAQANFRAAEAALLDERDRNVGAAVGAVVARWVRQTAVEGSRPQVFRRANELLGKFTRYTLEVELDDTGTPAFRGRSGTGQSRVLRELSGGERVQLLMAVRVAFLEQDETVKLPLLVDEVLGTSDDARAGEIIDSVIALAREGRQIFYFTAQHDEIAKWKARLTEAGVPYRDFDLARLRNLAAAQTTPLAITALEVPTPLAPEGMSHADYGRVLNVPGIDPAADTLDDLHLWHLVGDVELLHRLLCQQIVTWRQLQLLLKQNGVDLVPGLDEARPRIEAAAKATAAVCRAWQIGRGKPVDRAALQDSGAVSATFIDSVAELAVKQHGDARAVLAALEAGEVPRWRATNTERLTEYLAGHGYLPHETPLPPDEIRLQVLASLAPELREGTLDRALVERLVATVIEL